MQRGPPPRTNGGTTASQAPATMPSAAPNRHMDTNAGTAATTSNLSQGWTAIRHPVTGVMIPRPNPPEALDSRTPAVALYTGGLRTCQITSHTDGQNRAATNTVLQAAVHDPFRDSVPNPLGSHPVPQSIGHLPNANRDSTTKPVHGDANHNPPPPSQTSATSTAAATTTRRVPEQGVSGSPARPVTPTLKPNAAAATFNLPLPPVPPTSPSNSNAQAANPSPSLSPPPATDAPQDITSPSSPPSTQTQDAIARGCSRPSAPSTKRAPAPLDLSRARETACSGGTGALPSGRPTTCAADADGRRTTSRAAPPLARRTLEKMEVEGLRERIEFLCERVAELRRELRRAKTGWGQACVRDADARRGIRELEADNETLREKLRECQGREVEMRAELDRWENWTR
ncbi:hypothetical protein H2203_002308 [Taxawa tesnikishii (nom. ined.)]|nr:hypothetical protein H2203_002308 [Dothideales sp. JES 119]